MPPLEQHKRTASWAQAQGYYPSQRVDWTMNLRSGSAMPSSMAESVLSLGRQSAGQTTETALIVGYDPHRADQRGIRSQFDF